MANQSPGNDTPTETFHFVFDLPTTQFYKWNEMKVARDAELQSDLVTSLGTFQADNDSKASIQEVINHLREQKAAGTPTTAKYVMKDNTVIDVTEVQMTKLYKAMLQRDQITREKSFTKRAVINAAASVSQVQGITWNSTP